MPIPKPEAWPNDLNEAAALQEQLAARVALHDNFGPVRHVAGVDVGFETDGTITRAAIAVLAFPELELRDHAIARLPTSFPYIPGYLSFRELPAVLAALEQLHVAPDLLLCDGQGIAHPRRLGIASHLGVVVDLPSIGVAKSILVGTHAALGDERGAWQPLMHRGEQVGAALRTRPGTRPLIISSGHRISLPTALDFVLRCSPRYRLPETTRWAHRLASDKRYRTAEHKIDPERKNSN